MSFLVRRTRKAVWVGATRDRAEAVTEFARDDVDSDGLSVFEVTNDAERDAVVAAIACQRTNTGRVDLIEVEREVIERFGEIDDTPDKGTTPLADANRLHRSLDWSDAALQHLAEHLFDSETEPREFAPARVKEIIRRITPEDVIGDEAQAFVRSEQAKKKP